MRQRGEMRAVRVEGQEKRDQSIATEEHHAREELEY